MTTGSPFNPWTDPESLASTLLVSYVDRVGHDDAGRFDPACLTWEPATVRHEATLAAGDSLPEANFARLMAALAILGTDRFWNEPRAFNDVCLVLSGHVPGGGGFEAADLADLAWGTTEALLLAAPDDADPFSTAVRRYMGLALDQEGFVRGPDVLGLAIRPEPRVADLTADAAQASATREREIETIVRGKLLLLGAQLASLTLRHGDVRRLVTAIDRKLAR